MDVVKGVRDRAILATLLYHGIRREELCLMRLRDMQSRQGVRIKGKRDKIRFIPMHAMALRLIRSAVRRLHVNDVPRRSFAAAGISTVRGRRFAHTRLSLPDAAPGTLPLFAVTEQATP